MSTFALKIDRLAETLALCAAEDVVALASALRAGIKKRVVAVGSGGSAIAAEYLAVCRRSLTSMDTRVQTPLEFVLGAESLEQTDVWIFSASGSNSDILAVADALRIRGYAAVHVVTRECESPLKDELKSFERVTVHVLGAADPKDGFLATHSLVAAVHVLLLASDQLSQNPLGQNLRTRFATDVTELIRSDERDRFAETMSTISQDHSVFVLQDPRLTPMALLIETCAWEAALCAVQRTDFRNFAHGRHVWLGGRGDTSFILALVGTETAEMWSDIRSLLPAQIQSYAMNFGNCGRYRNALGVVAGLCLVEAMGRASGVDPGKPGIAPFSRSLFEAPSLLNLEDQLTARVRHKALAVNERDDPDASECDLVEISDAVLQRLSEISFAALVIDYDGTMVATEMRTCPPSEDIVRELQRLMGEGMKVAIATGRGGSAGEVLRPCFPDRHDEMLVSYYNGSLTRTLGEDISAAPQGMDPSLEEVRQWLNDAALAGRRLDFHESGVQITVPLDQPHAGDDLLHVLEVEANTQGRARIVRSGHTLDVCNGETCKTTVARQLAEAANSPIETVLCIGDSGSWRGNDHALLGLPSGISVNRVCDRVDVCWSIFGGQLTGPAALLRIMRALKKGVNGGHMLCVELLETREDFGTKQEHNCGSLATGGAL
jgi:fructoselysine-6-P-deglycase FrlB-like protein